MIFSSYPIWIIITILCSVYIYLKDRFVEVKVCREIQNKKRESFGLPVHSPTGSISMANQDCSQESETFSKALTQMIEAYFLGSSSIVFPDALEGSYDGP